MITSLKPNEIFVFGSNKDGFHAGGAAKQAHEQFGAEWGVGKGMTGQCYAIDTMSGQDEFQNNLEGFVRYAKKHPKKQFLLTKVGCGIAGYKEENMKELFKNSPKNVVLPEGWL